MSLVPRQTTHNSSFVPPAAKRLRISITAHSCATHQNALECSRKLAALRVQERSKAAPLLADPFAEALAEHVEAVAAVADSPACDMLSARFVDDQVLAVTSLTNVQRKQDYNQVVLVGDGMCTRAFRLPWPTGTVIYLCAPGEVHERAEAILAAHNARVPRGCLLRRVDADLQGGHSFADALERAGYRGDRLSVWALQGINCLGLSSEALGSILLDMVNLAALDSVTVGELPAMTHPEANNLLATYGLLASLVDFTPVELLGAEAIGECVTTTGTCPGVGEAQPWLFRAMQRRLSWSEMATYEDHVAAAEDADEDFFGNFS